MPDEARTIPARAVGGFAGGAKFFVNGMMWKLALDPRRGSTFLYSNSVLPTADAAHDKR